MDQCLLDNLLWLQFLFSAYLGIFKEKPLREFKISPMGPLRYFNGLLLTQYLDVQWGGLKGLFKEKPGRE